MINEKIIGLFTAKPNFLRPSGKLSAIKKNSLESLEIKLDHLPGDEVADKKHHGGLKRVIHHYSMENFNLLKEKFPEHQELFIPGSYGENITTQNISEKDLYLGDIFKLGSALVELTIPRAPCSTIDDYYGFRGSLKEILDNCHYGWFYRVLKEGEVKIGDSIELLDRPNPNLNLHQLILQIKNKAPKDKVFLEAASKIDALDDKWKDDVMKALAKA